MMRDNYRSSKIFEFFFILVYLLSNIQIFSQSFPVQTYTLENGLNTNFIHDVTQDKQGRMWFATEYGVSVYDSYTWKNYSDKDGLPRDEYFLIKVDSSNNIIAVPYSSRTHIAIFKNNKWTLIDEIPQLNGIHKNYTSFDLIYENDKQILYFGTNEGLFFYKNRKWNRISQKEGLIDDRVNTVKSFQNKLYVCTENGLSVIHDGKIDNSLNSIINIPAKKIKSIEFEILKNNSVPNIWLLGNKWIGTIQNRKFNLVTSNNGMTTEFPTQKLRHICFLYDKVDRIYYGNEVERFYLEKSTKKVITVSQENRFTTEGSSAIFLDRESNLWFTSFRGIDKVSNFCFQNFFKENGLLENEVSSTIEVTPGYYIFGHNHGLTILKDGKFSTVTLAHPSDKNYSLSRIMDLCTDSTGNVWIAGSELGVGKMSNSKEINWIKYKKTIQINSIKTDKQGTLWVGSDQGLFKISEDHSNLVLINNKEFLNIRKIFSDADGTIYGACYDGLAIYKNGVFTKLSDSRIQFGNSIYAVHDYTDNKKILGTADGLYLLDGGSIRKFHENNFSIDKKVFFITLDKNNNYWFGTNDGVVKWDGKTARRFSLEGGLAGRETNRSAYTVDSFGKVWIGTDRGLSCYDPQYDIPAKPPKLISLEIGDSDGKFHNMDKPFCSGSGENSYTFRIKAISFLHEKFIQYRTKLNGFDKDWIVNGNNNYIRYTNLPPGDFRLLVQVKNLGSEWSKTFTSNLITIDKPFYYQWWFLLFSIFLISFILYSFNHYTTQLKYSAKLEASVTERTKSLVESESKLKTIIQNAPNTISVINRKGAFLYIDQIGNASTLTNESLPKTIWDYLPSEKVEYVQNVLEEVFNNSKTVWYEINFMDRNNIEHWVENSISPVITEGIILEAIIISSDVTERKLNEITRREIEDRQEAILKALPLVFYNSSSDSKFGATWITENVCSLTGFGVNKFLNEEYFWSSRLHPDDKELVMKEFENISLGKSIKVEYRWLCADGYYKWFLDYAVPKEIHESGNKNILGLLIDITDRKQIQQRLERLNECLLNFGINPKENIQRLITLCGTEMNASFVLYNFLKDDLIHNIASWNLKDEIEPFAQEGRLSNKVFLNNSKELIFINNVDQTLFAETDPLVKQFGIKTYIGAPVMIGDKTKASLCLIYQTQKQISESDLKFIGIISSAIAVEEERQLSQEIIQNSLKEKEILLKEIHHRVKNNLQVISSLLYLQSADIEDEKTLAMFKDSTSRVRSVALVHEKLYQSMDLAHIYFEEYINNLVVYLINSYSLKINITKRIEVEKLFLSVDTAIPCGLIVTELVTNSIKYAFPNDLIKNPEILVSVKKNGQQIVIIVADNGIGLPEYINIDTEQKSLGLKLIRMLTEQLNGKIQLDEHIGTKFRITFENII